MQELIQHIKTKNATDALFSYMNLNDEPKKKHVSKETLLFDSWLRTGIHLRKALTRYDREEDSQKTNSRRG